MGDPADHLRASEQNKKRAEAFATASDPWEIVLLFYSALHLVQGYLETKSARFAADDHRARRAAMKAAPELRNTLVPYQDLQDLSVQVRYDAGFVPKPIDYQNAQLWFEKTRTIVEPKLKRILGVP